MNKKLKSALKLTAAGLSAMMAVALPACTDPYANAGEGYTYRNYTAVSPSDWNILTYRDNNDTQIMDYINSKFFEFDYEFLNGEKFSSDGKVLSENIVENGYTVNYSAATALKDVTGDYAEQWGYSGNASGYAWKITLRDDLKWQDGTKITADDFVYSMQEQLNPLFKNYRADNFYNGTVILKNAKNYFYQNTSGYYMASSTFEEYTNELDSRLIFTLASSAENNNYGGAVAKTRDNLGITSKLNLSETAAHIAQQTQNLTANELVALEKKSLAEIRANTALSATFKKLETAFSKDKNDTLNYFIVNYTYPELDFSKVGIFKGESDSEIVICLENPLKLLNDDGTLNYRAAYYLDSLPLVKPDLYESCKRSPVEGSTLWTTNYNTTLSTTASWGPYKLSSFQSGTAYTLERNENWFGYGLDMYKGQYMTDKIEVRTISEVNTAWLAFLSGELDDAAIDVTRADTYRNSKYAYYKPSQLTASVQLQSSKDSLIKRGGNRVVLANADFRKAVSLGIDRAEYARTCTTSSIEGFGLLNEQYYYDVENSGVYRKTEQAKIALLHAYGFENVGGVWSDGHNDYTSLDEAYAALTGYDLSKARELVTAAYNQLLTEESFNKDEKITLTFGSSTDNENTRRHYNYFVKVFADITSGTPLENRVEVVFNGSYGSTWATQFRGGAYDIAAGTGWSGGAFNPGYMLMAYIDPNYMYSTGWDTQNHFMSFTMPDGDYLGAGQTFNLNMLEWYARLNGTSSSEYDFSSGKIDEQARLSLIARMEQEILEQYYTVPTYYGYSSFLHGMKVEHISYDYNTFMEFGGIRYMNYNFNDREWLKFADANKIGGELNYRVSD